MTLLLERFGDFAAAYETLICDVWGVIHNGATAHPAACAALKTFRDRGGRVVLLSNAPRPPSDLEPQFERIGVPLDCYDTIVTSGGAAREDLARRAGPGGLRMLHLGPERDRNLYLGLNITLSDVADAQIILCTGPYDDETETPDDYKDRLAAYHARKLTMLCANPDRVVQRGGKLVYCAGSLAEAYEKIGGKVIYYGKPHLPIYAHVRAVAGGAPKALAIGDGLATDIRGANAAGIDALFIADGIHGEDVSEFTEAQIGKLFAGAGVHAKAAMRALVW
ncbi:MAG: TIGR01459 family HAD-type hydrolase [Proteobacteria bacterium]|nr:TIGR01459 family HAD-type hydrolase [Pseudomonadota bacterium]